MSRACCRDAHIVHTLLLSCASVARCFRCTAASPALCVPRGVRGDRGHTVRAGPAVSRLRSVDLGDLSSGLGPFFFILMHHRQRRSPALAETVKHGRSHKTTVSKTLDRVRHVRDTVPFLLEENVAGFARHDAYNGSCRDSRHRLVPREGIPRREYSSSRPTARKAPSPSGSSLSFEKW